jgi:hypothetical protein
MLFNNLGLQFWMRENLRLKSQFARERAFETTLFVLKYDTKSKFCNNVINVIFPYNYY